MFCLQGLLRRPQAGMETGTTAPKLLNLLLASQTNQAYADQQDNLGTLKGYKASWVQGYNTCPTKHAGRPQFSCPFDQLVASVNALHRLPHTSSCLTALTLTSPPDATSCWGCRFCMIVPICHATCLGSQGRPTPRSLGSLTRRSQQYKSHRQTGIRSTAFSRRTLQKKGAGSGEVTIHANLLTPQPPAELCQGQL